MRERLSRSLNWVFDGSDVSPLAVKVPQITALFWVIKITSTAMGEALADFLDGGDGLVFPAIGAVVALAAFIAAMRIQFRTTRYVASAYWFAVAMVATFGTMAADSFHQFLGVPYVYVTAVYAAILVVVFWRWWANEGTLSIHSIDTRRRERFYWGTVFATFALGTATGDWTATELKLGFFSSGLLFAGAIVLPAIAYRLGGNPIATFWVAYVITRPLGASFADWMDFPKRSGGLGWGTWPVWTALAVVMVGLVSTLVVRDRREDPGAAPDSQHVDATRHPHHAQVGHIDLAIE